MANQNTSTRIVNGPSREELFDSLRLCSESRTVVFEFDDSGRYKKDAQVMMLTPEDGSGNKWLLEVYVQVDKEKKIATGYYDTKARTGYLSGK